MSMLSQENKDKIYITMYDNEQLPEDSKSFFRHIRPDYRLEIRDFNVELELDDSQVETHEGNVCTYDLNWGDLFLSVINYCDSPDYINAILETNVLELFKTKKDLTNEISNAIYSKKEPADKFKLLANNDILKKNKMLNIYTKNLALYGSLQNLFQLDMQKQDGIFTTFLLWLFGTTDPKIISTEQIRKNLCNESSLRSINVTINYGQWGIPAEYSFSDFGDAVLYDLNELVKKDITIKRCENCGRYFIPSVRSDEKYCYYIYKHNKSCKQLGFSNLLKSNDVLREYRKIYKTQNARKRRNKKNILQIDLFFSQWARFAKKQFELCQEGKISLQTLKNRISDDNWMNGGIKNVNDSKAGK